LYQVQLKKAQEEISKVQAEKARDEAEHATTKLARSIARKLRERRLVDIVREEGRRVSLREGLTRRRGINYIDQGHGCRCEIDRGLDDYHNRATRNPHSPLPRTTTS